MSEPRTSRRNFGPGFGCDLIVLGDKVTPRPLEHAVVYLVALVGLVVARQNIPHSRAYLEAVTGRPASIFQIWKHYQRMVFGLVRKLRAARGITPRVVLPPTAPADYAKLRDSGDGLLFGTFHVGDSDLLGCLLGPFFSKRVTMVRLRVGNSDDTERLVGRFGEHIDYLWINRPEDVLFGIKNALSEGRPIALQCDRDEYASRTEYFRFLGTRRRFPFTIYHLSALLRKPVAIAFAVPRADGASELHTPPVFTPCAKASRDEVLRAGAEHFQGVLDTLEGLLRRDPYVWFNFTPLNPPESASAEPAGAGR